MEMMERVAAEDEPALAIEHAQTGPTQNRRDLLAVAGMEVVIP